MKAERLLDVMKEHSNDDDLRKWEEETCREFDEVCIALEKCKKISDRYKLKKHLKELKMVYELITLMQEQRRIGLSCLR